MTSNNKINIAIDGFSASGKSTIARKLAKMMNYIYLDTGSMYRAVTLYFIENNIDLNDIESVRKALKNIRLNFVSVNGINNILLNESDVSEKIRSLEVSGNVSQVAEISEVRRFLVKQQKEIAIAKGVIMDGRDIGTVVMPDAEIKIYLTTDERVRIARRLLELKNKGIDTTYDEVKSNIRSRDIIDSTREDSPLRIAENSMIIDNSKDKEEEIIQYLYSIAMSKIKKTNTIAN